METILVIGLSIILAIWFLFCWRHYG